jgi:uncharacterized protein (TIGR03437 family)
VFKAILCGLFFCALAAAQTITSAGYAFPIPVSVAPGQILTFFVDGIGTTGITAALRQGTDVPAPIIDVRPVSTCNLAIDPPSAACATFTAVTVQIPYELIPFCPLCASAFLRPAQLIVSGNGSSATVALNPLADQVHVLSSCDIVMSPKATVPPVFYATGLPCTPIVTHADGTIVSASSPANVGEELTAWTTGLGATNPAAATGKASTKSFPTAETLGIHYNYTVNALATKPRPPFVPAPTPAPVFSGLASGFVGLYQINFVVPSSPPNGIAQCSLTGTFAAGANIVQSNLTVSFGGSSSFDGAGICVATRIPVD